MQCMHFQLWQFCFCFDNMVYGVLIDVEKINLKQFKTTLTLRTKNYA